MDDIIAESGMSPNAVYRYFRSKDALIDAAADESLVLMRDLFASLVEQSPPPTLTDVLTALVGALNRQSTAAGYDLSRITIQAWGEALRRPALHQRAARFYSEARTNLAVLAREWQSGGQLLPDIDADAAAAVLFALMPGMIIARHLSEPLTARDLLTGISTLATAASTSARGSRLPELKNATADPSAGAPRSHRRSGDDDDRVR